jgi:hypothetical protein
MSAQEQPAKELISVRVKPEEYKKIYHFYEGTTCRKFSEYVRRVLLQKPTTVSYRNQSAEDLLVCMNQLKNELNAAGNNFNQAIRKLHQFDSVPEIKVWLLINEPLKQNLLKKIEEIRLQMNQIYEQWSLK